MQEFRFNPKGIKQICVDGGYRIGAASESNIVIRVDRGASAVKRGSTIKVTSGVGIHAWIMIPLGSQPKITKSK
jgi:uncharacterized lipoprotein YajG